MKRIIIITIFQISLYVNAKPQLDLIDEVNKQILTFLQNQKELEDKRITYKEVQQFVFFEEICHKDKNVNRDFGIYLFHTNYIYPPNRYLLVKNAGESYIIDANIESFVEFFWGTNSLFEITNNEELTKYLICFKTVDNEYRRPLVIENDLSVKSEKKIILKYYKIKFLDEY